MRNLKCDLLIIGAGSGGLSLAAGASQMGADVILLEGHKMGGDCLNYGCVPSKALLASGHAAHAQSHSAAFGIADHLPAVDYAAAKAHVQRVIDTIAPVDSQERFEGFGVRVIRAEGRFVDAKTVEAGDTRITARRIVIATGSRPFVPPIPGLDQVPYLTNETLWALTERPDHLIIIGGGPIGLEMAQAHRRLGSQVTVIETQTAMGREDPEAAALLLEALRGEGIAVLEQTEAQSVHQDGAEIVVETAAGAIRGSHLLVAVGRVPNV